MNSESYYAIDADDKRTNWSAKRISYILLITLLVLVILALLIAFVIIPIVFMLSFTVQAAVMFVRFNLPTDIKYFDLDVPGLKNFYVNVTDVETKGQIILGAWHLLPWALVNDSMTEPNFDFDEALANSEYDVIVHFHGTGETRRDSSRLFSILRQFFHVIAFDYRGYGDSSRGIMTENAVIEDCKQFCKWLWTKTNAKIYIWGHSLGASLAPSTVARLKSDRIVPEGLVLEAPFTTMREEIPVHPYGKIFAWLPWFKATIQDPLEENGFHFNNIVSLRNVDCPIVIFHAEDDSVIPYWLGKKLATISTEDRNFAQGNVTYHQIPARYNCDHFRIYNFPDLSAYILNFINGTEIPTENATDIYAG